LPDGERIVSLGLRNQATNGTERRLLHDFFAWRAELETIQDVGAFRMASRNLISPDGQIERLRLAEMTASGFRVAAVPPLLGRALLDSDEVEGAPPVVVIGHDVWTERFGANPGVVGRTMQLDRTSHTIVGVMPKDFGFPLADELWIPLHWDPDDHPTLVGSSRAFAFGRLAPGETLVTAQAEITAIGNRRAAELPATHEHIRALVMPYTDTHTGMDGPPAGGGSQGLGISMVITFFTLILTIPFANVAILFYARTATRAGEIAVRSALGASRRRVVTQLFVEALILAGVAGAAGAALAVFALGRFHDIWEFSFGGLPFWATGGRNAMTVAYAAGLTVLAGVVAGAVPGLKATRRDVQSNLSRLPSGNGMRLGGTWTALIVVQVAVTVACMPPTVSLAWALLEPTEVEPTFPDAGIVVAQVAVAPFADPAGESDSERPRWAEEIVRRVGEIQTVSAVTYATALPGNTSRSAVIEVEGFASIEGRVRHPVGGASVAPGFFDAIGATVQAGRTFDSRDLEPQSRPVVVNASFARELLVEASAVGRRLRYHSDTGPGPWREIVGVVDDLTRARRPDASANSRPVVFELLSAADPLPRQIVIARVASDPSSFAVRMRDIVVAVDPALQLGYVGPLGEVPSPIRSLSRWGAIGVALAIMSVLLMATAGIYALMSFNVTQRRREIGIRSALGADRKYVLVVVLSRALRQLGAGVLLGLVGAALIGDALVNAIGLPPRSDTAPLVVVSALILSVGLLGAIGPARRGLRIEPTAALREE
jgi:predicted permease